MREVCFPTIRKHTTNEDGTMAKTTGAVLPKAGIAFMVFAVAGVACGAGRTNWIVNGSSNWNDPNSYVDTSFVPEADDVVVIPSGASVSVSSTDATSFSLVAKLSSVCFTDTSSVLTFDIAEGDDVLIDCVFGKLGSDWKSGQVVKKGKGRLTAGDGSKYPLGVDWNYYAIPLRIEEGEWRCAQGINPGNSADTTGKSEYYFGGVEVCSNAVFRLSSGNFLYTAVDGLWGDGTVTTASGETRQFRIRPDRSGKTSVFGGVMDRGVKYFSNGRVMLIGTNSTMNATASVFGGYRNYATNDGYTAVMKFGNAGEPSSIGTSDTVDVNTRGGGWGYLGMGETTGKTFCWYPHHDNGESYVSMLLDGGAHGGLSFTGHWKPVDNRKGIGCIVLTGSNTISACVVDCPIQFDKTSSNSNYTNPVSVIKTGTGVWRFKHSKYRDLLGVFDIQQGTLQADSFEEAGVQSALGFATNMYVEGFASNNDQIPSAEKRVTDYAIVLGAETSDSIAGVSTEGIFEYMGTNSACCFTRPFVLDGDARLKNGTDYRFWTGKVRSRSAGSKTLTLDGDSSKTNLVADISDASGGVVSIAKEGCGTWIVTGTNDIRGNIAVKAGTLILQNINGQPYTWHKWQIRSNYASSTVPDSNTSKIRPCEFGLFNAAGKRVNSYLQYCDAYQDLNPGQAAYATHIKRYGSIKTADSEINLFRLFDKSSASAGIRIEYRSDAGNDQSGLVPQENKPETWQTIMMRLSNGADEVASWDYSDYYGLEGSEGGTRQMNIKTSALYGSANGANWELLAVAANVPMREKKGLWAFDGRTIAGEHANCNTIEARVGQNVYPFLEKMAGTVSVAPGATLICEGAPVAFSKIALDAIGAGTIKNASFAADGEIFIENAQNKDKIAFSGLFDGCDSESNLERWTIREDGNLSVRLRAVVRGGNLRLVRKGFFVSFR